MILRNIIDIFGCLDDNETFPLRFHNDVIVDYAINTSTGIHHFLYNVNKRLNNIVGVELPTMICDVNTLPILIGILRRVLIHHSNTSSTFNVNLEKAIWFLKRYALEYNDMSFTEHWLIRNTPQILTGERRVNDEELSFLTPLFDVYFSIDENSSSIKHFCLLQKHIQGD